MCLTRPVTPLFVIAMLITGILAPVELHPQAAGSTDRSQLRLHLALPHAQKHAAVPAIIWLEPMPGTPASPFIPHDHYTLLQKNRVFIPHLLVVPVGGVVQFPNQDPFFHNVFSLFDGKRFDLGLYEAGSSKAVNFSREGVAYIFCNIHPEMSAVVIALSTPLYAMADRGNIFNLTDIPTGSYRLHIWIEGFPPSKLDSMTKVVHLSPGNQDLGLIQLPITSLSPKVHTDEYGRPYAPTTQNPY